MNAIMHCVRRAAGRKEAGRCARVRAAHRLIGWKQRLKGDCASAIG
jgi:hypothetical protein